MVLKNKKNNTKKIVSRTDKFLRVLCLLLFLYLIASAFTIINSLPMLTCLTAFFVGWSIGYIFSNRFDLFIHGGVN